MKFKKNVLSIVICFCLIVGMIPSVVFTAFADSKIQIDTIKVTVNKDYLPKDGVECVDYVDFFTVAKGEVYEEDSFGGAWYDDVKDPQNQSFTGVRWHTINQYADYIGYDFEAGRSYYYCASFRIKSDFESTHKFPTTEDNVVKFEIKNLASSEYEVYATNGRAGQIYAIIKFKAPGERTYNDIKTVHANVYGPNSYQSNSLPPVCNKSSPWISTHYANYDFDYEWFGEFNIDKSNVKRFKPNEKYKLVFTYTAKDGYKFAPDCDFFFAKYTNYFEDSDVQAVPKSISVEDGRKKLIVTFEFFVTDYDYINTLVLENSNGSNLLPETGMKLADLSNSVYVDIAQYPYAGSYTYDFYEAKNWHDDMGDQIVYAPRTGLCHFTYLLYTWFLQTELFGINTQIIKMKRLLCWMVKPSLQENTNILLKF